MDNSVKIVILISMHHDYRGRFAPSPTGPLHFGSLIAALGSFLQARALRGCWLVRIEDLDPPREVARAADEILRCLDAFGLHWDEEVWYQSRRNEAYSAALEELGRLGVTYHCGCSRKELAGHEIYPGICRAGLPNGKTPRAVRLCAPTVSIEFTDLVQGRQHQDIARTLGDFVIRRADALFAYSLAVVVDDAAQGISEIIRGSDLLELTGGQIHIQRLLGLPTPQYGHLPIAVNQQGEKLSKQTYAPPLDYKNPTPALWRALAFLGLTPPLELRRESARLLLDWGLDQWTIQSVPKVRAMPLLES
ncbi:MAG: tRNA glutamyl-Q(34) synthetase GluQRS [Pseudomonadota bacterium]